MDKNIDITAEELKSQIYNLIENCGLPFSIIYYLFKDFMTDLTESYRVYINEEYNKYQESLKKKAMGEESPKTQEKTSSEETKKEE